MSRFFKGLRLHFADLSSFHIAAPEHRKVVGRVRTQEEGCPLENTLPADRVDPICMPRTRDKETASESEAMSGQPISFEKKIFVALKKLLRTEWVAA